MARLVRDRWPALAYGLLAIVFLASPFLANFGAEPAAAMAATAFFATAIYVRPSDRLVRLPALGRALLFLVPAALVITLGKFLYGPCDPVRSLAFFLLFPCVSVVFGFAVKTFLVAARVPRPTVCGILIGIFVVVVPVVVDIGFHPQFYTYNHVFGGFLGPIYDGYRPITFGLVAFRTLTLLWSAFLVVAALHFRRSRSSRSLLTGLAALSITICGAYVLAPRIGFVSTHGHISRSLGGHYATEHFDLYYSPAAATDEEVLHLARTHEYRYAMLREAFGSEPEGRVRSYVFPDAATKGRLTGARRTSVSPVWLRQPQIHVTRDLVDRTLAHELAHVFSRSHGLPVLNASIHVGLVEGLAVAVEPPDGRPSTHEIAASAPGGTPEPGRLGAAAFWGGRAAVSYTTMGSFVKYLVARFGMTKFLEAYPTGDFEGALGLTLDELARGWSEYLNSLDYVCVDAGPYARRAFAVPSAFEVTCPFEEPEHIRLIETASDLVAARDTVAARVEAHRAWTFAPSSRLVAATAASLAIGAGAYGEAENYLSAVEIEGPVLNMLAGDLSSAKGDVETARRHYATALGGAPRYLRNLRSALLLRSAVADRPDLVVQLYGRPAGSVGQDLGRGRLLLARRSFQIGDHRRAFELMGSDEPEFGDAVSELQARVAYWRAEIAAAGGHLLAAVQSAEYAATSYAAMGDVNGFRETQDLIGYIRWLSRVQDDGDSSP